MRTYRLLIALLLLLCMPRFSHAADDYNLGPDFQVKDVPHGVVTHATWTGSKIFPGTVHDYWVYVLKQYDPATPACVMIFQDGGGFQSTNGGFRVPEIRASAHSRLYAGRLRRSSLLAPDCNYSL